ncbi:helix-turn-helix domain-containing protein [Actinosynnema mirum]|uniref:Helix-turn-helix domain protein n=1 Tax=Actinosynnema mirum (strain ATCC 29888 / DSM 43827 / JCM 3225 / NBRC 14064 / NCIMB 13271 / NRRL B-12336 / IMRU 3971 / 101) TaxID=446462 RepID=C6WND8_ACTMD|nr:helix-turn-helix transcriptional regulator [Actinosynnema mirum]ACU40502.1 helix-turn-helix domain protein [Actinosynnema mirum DSM 43827]
MHARQTVERRQLGLSLKRFRVAKGVSQAELGRVIGQSDSRISKVEDGTGTLNADQLTAALDHLDVHGDDRRTVLELGARARKRLRRGANDQQPYTDTLPGSFQRLADMEADASAIHCYEPGVVPGLLQAPGYIRAVMRSGEGVFWKPSAAEIESRYLFRRNRQITTLEAERPKKLEFVFTENALDGYEGGEEVVREQLEHLLHLLKRHQNITVQLLRVGDLRNPVATGGIAVLDFDETAPRVAFATAAYGPSTYFDDKADTDPLVRAFQRLQELACDHAESVELIHKKLMEV